MIKRSKWQDPERGAGAGERGSGGRDRSVAPADDQQRVPTLSDRTAANLALAALEQLDFVVDPGPGKRIGDLFADRRRRSERTGAAIEEGRDARHGQALTRPCLFVILVN